MPVTRNQHFVLAAVLAIAGVVLLLLGISRLADVRSYIAKNYQHYSSSADGERYTCDGPPATVADTLAAEQRPEARASDRGIEYLRYDDYIVTVGADSPRPCSIRVEDIAGGYSRGSYIFLGPGFTPGSPAGGSGGSSGGPDGAK